MGIDVVDVTQDRCIFLAPLWRPGKFWKAAVAVASVGSGRANQKHQVVSILVWENRWMSLRGNQDYSGRFAEEVVALYEDFQRCQIDPDGFLICRLTGEPAMADPYQRISYLLKALEKEMRSLDLWSSTPPAEQALASSMPFCYDTLDFSEWLQWIFIPRLHLLLYETLPLAVKGWRNINSSELIATAPRRGHTFYSCG